ncbi:MAG: hypothetical protein RB292_04410 [Patescibacteria group bacterium]|jgi:hypothetical protein|nr:hypothetical protein [Patescibacteria group bacterium]
MFSSLNRLSGLFDHRPWLAYLLLAVAAITLFSYLHFDYTFADPDSFYHAKMAQFLVEKGAITEFPWLYFTSLRFNFIDHHFLYHLLLIPFVYVFSPLIGLKIATVLFSVLVILAFFWFLRALKIKGAFWYSLFLLTIGPFIFRLSLAKAQSLVILFLFIFLYLLLNRRYLGLVLISCFYVWLYAGWPLVLLITLLYLVINALGSYVAQNNWFFWLTKWFKVQWQNFLVLASVVLGLIAGLFFNPYFPKNFGFYWQQSFQIALVNYQNFIRVGAEWYPYNLLELLTNAIPLFVVLIIALIGFVVSAKKQPINSWLFFFLGSIFFFLTLKSRRYIEYFIPLSLIFSALSINIWQAELTAKLRQIFSQKILWLMVLILIFAFSPAFYFGIIDVKNYYHQGFDFDKFAASSAWLANNTQAGDVVFHSDWDEFPILFYHNDHNYYIVGLDPTFMYSYDPGLHNLWANITLGLTNENLVSVIHDVFKSKYVFVDYRQNVDFDRNLNNNIFLQKVYEDEEARIYQITQ